MLNYDEKCILHFDVSSCASEDINLLLFECLFLRHIKTSFNDRFHFSNCHAIFIELPTKMCSIPKMMTEKQITINRQKQIEKIYYDSDDEEKIEFEELNCKKKDNIKQKMGIEIQGMRRMCLCIIMCVCVLFHVTKDTLDLFFFLSKLTFLKDLNIIYICLVFFF